MRNDCVNIKEYMEKKKAQIDRALDEVLPGEEVFPPTLHKAMRYCIFAGGKRLRPILALAAAEAVGGNADCLLTESCSLELIHTYTLIHDDLPAMDDDDVRRGMPTAHKVFGEALAVLAGDALQTEAFKILAGSGTKGLHEPERLLNVICILAGASGSQGLVGGQTVDVESEDKKIDRNLLDYIHTHKTGSLITAAVLMGGILGGGSDEAVGCLRRYAAEIGLLFQITDDLLDVLGSADAIGKAVGGDAQRGKATYPALVGVEEAQKIQQELYEKSLGALTGFGAQAEPLRALAEFIKNRNI